MRRTASLFAVPGGPTTKQVLARHRAQHNELHQRFAIDQTARGVGDRRTNVIGRRLGV